MIRIPIKQPVFSWNVRPFFFFVAHLWRWGKCPGTCACAATGAAGVRAAGRRAGAGRRLLVFVAWLGTARKLGTVEDDHNNKKKACFNLFFFWRRRRRKTWWKHDTQKTTASLIFMCECVGRFLFLLGLFGQFLSNDNIASHVHRTPHRFGKHIVLIYIYIYVWYIWYIIYSVCDR